MDDDDTGAELVHSQKEVDLKRRNKKKKRPLDDSNNDQSQQEEDHDSSEKRTPPRTSKRRRLPYTSPPSGPPPLTLQSQGRNRRGHMTRSAVGPSLLQHSFHQQSLANKKVFWFSGLHDSEVGHYAAIVIQLGGEAVVDPSDKRQCTHLVMGTVKRTAKYLMAVTTGAWVLATSYMDASRTAGYFVAEKDHEIFGHAVASDGRVWMGSARRARIQKQETGGGLFQGWRVGVLGEENMGADEPGKEIVLSVLSAGEGEVVELRRPLSGNALAGLRAVVASTTYAHDDIIETLLQTCIPIIRASYIADYVSFERQPRLDDPAYVLFVPPKPVIKASPASKKRPRRNSLKAS